jgi:hypothetical protein
LTVVLTLNGLLAVPAPVTPLCDPGENGVVGPSADVAVLPWLAKSGA